MDQLDDRQTSDDDSHPNEASSSVVAEQSSLKPYEKLDRREIRLYRTQVTRLESMASRLSRERRARGDSGQVINKSTLIRAAVAVLIEARGAIHGSTEAEISDSLRRWLTTNPDGDPLPRQTRDALRDARRQLASIDRLLDRAANTAGNATSAPQCASGASSPRGLPKSPETP